uniref:Flagella basal body P-ring formation protein FlgA n=1 Tax=Ectopseudomonas mendocina (strain ymp) TaxID=399739 RepID=A4XNR3_ECTM1
MPNLQESSRPLIYQDFLGAHGALRVALLPHRRSRERKSGKVFSACALALFLFALLPSAVLRAEVEAAGQIDQAIAAHMQQQLAAEAKRQAWQGMRHSLGITLLSSAEQLPACSQALELTVASDDPSPLARQRLQLRCADAPGWTRVALVQASVFVAAVHAARVIERGQTIAAEQVQLQEVNVGRSSRGFYSSLDEVVGQGAKRRIRAGALIAPSLLSAPLLVRRGQQVTIVANQDGISASATGEALGNGREGEVIRVRNLGSQKVIEAQVVEEGVVTSTFR